MPRENVAIVLDSRITFEQRGGKIADLDCISLGPNIIDIHTVDEHLDIASTEKTYRLLQNVLRGMKE